MRNLPDPLNLPRACGSCPHLLACSLQQDLTESIPPSPHAMSELVPQTLGHLTQAHKDFFQLWSVICGLENEEAAKANKAKLLWCKTPQEREKDGVAITNLTLESDGDNGTHIFAAKSRLPNVFNPGETVVVSTDSDLALSQGIVMEKKENVITIVLDRDLKRSDDEGRLRMFILDRHEYQGSMSSSMVNLVKLMSSTEEAEKLRALLIDGKEAGFKKGLPREVGEKAKPMLKPLSKEQQVAILKAYMAEDFALIKGMPGKLNLSSKIKDI